MRIKSKFQAVVIVLGNGALAVSVKVPPTFRSTGSCLNLPIRISGPESKCLRVPDQSFCNTSCNLVLA